MSFEQVFLLKEDQYFSIGYHNTKSKKKKRYGKVRDSQFLKYQQEHIYDQEYYLTNIIGKLLPHNFVLLGMFHILQLWKNKIK